jgi:hypothetical protein
MGDTKIGKTLGHVPAGLVGQPSAEDAARLLAEDREMRAVLDACLCIAEPQPDPRDATIADLRARLAQAEAERDAAQGRDAWESAPPSSAEGIARAFHEAYERLAPAHGYQTRAASRVPWADVPASNRALMVSVVSELLCRGVLVGRDFLDTEIGARQAVMAALERLRPEHTHHCNSRYVHGDGAWCTCGAKDDRATLAHVVQLEADRDALRALAADALREGLACAERARRWARLWKEIAGHRSDLLSEATADRDALRARVELLDGVLRRLLEYPLTQVVRRSDVEAAERATREQWAYNDLDLHRVTGERDALRARVAAEQQAGDLARQVCVEQRTRGDALRALVRACRDAAPGEAWAHAWARLLDAAGRGEGGER